MPSDEQNEWPVLCVGDGFLRLEELDYHRSCSLELGESHDDIIQEQERSVTNTGLTYSCGEDAAISADETYPDQNRRARSGGALEQTTDAFSSELENNSTSFASAAHTDEKKEEDVHNVNCAYSKELSSVCALETGGEDKEEGDARVSENEEAPEDNVRLPSLLVRV